MSDLKTADLSTAIEEITYASKKFPGKAFQIVLANKDEAIPYLRSAIRKVLDERGQLEEGYQLHFYALFLLGEFQDREFFPEIMEFISLPGEVLDYLIGDLITSGLKDIVYNMYNGDMELLKKVIMNEQVEEFARVELLEVMGQLYLDGALKETEWKDFIRKNVYGGEEYSYFYDGLAQMICQCHFVDMLPDIKYMLDKELMDEMRMGEYDSCVDEMFDYEDQGKRFCQSSINTVESLRSWAMFEDLPEAEQKKMGKKEWEQLARKLLDDQKKADAVRKIGRNEPCPCGSGKKYKHCCLNKPKSPIDAIESLQERQKWLARYPYVGDEKQEGRIYLTDYFDTESIEIDKVLYLGLMHRPRLIWMRDEEQEEIRRRRYLTLAFHMFMDKVEKEKIQTFEAYDQKYSIHYFCEEWILELLCLLKESGEREFYRKVDRCRREMA